MEKFVANHGVLLRGSQGGALFDPASLSLFQVEAPRNTPLSALAEALSHRAEPESTPIPRHRRPAILPFKGGPAEARARSGLRLGRLTLNISNACNLWCSYCYADHGHYHSPRSFMAPDTARTIVERVLDLYGAVDSVQFFGGEPLMNLKAIDAVCDAFEAAREAGRIPRIPNFVATTNGTQSSPAVLEILKRRKISLTISWDGPREVHEKARPAVTKRSSYDDLIRSLERYRRNAIPFEIECTYGSHQYEAGYSVVDLLKFFQAELGHRVIHIAPAFLPRGDASEQEVFRGEAVANATKDALSADLLVETFREAARFSVANVFSGEGPILDFADRIIGQIIEKQRSAIYCPAFYSQISVATDGSVFPCFMFIGDRKFRMGNILADSFPNPESQRVLDDYFAGFDATVIEQKYWFSPFISGCVAGEYISAGNLSDRIALDLFEAMIEECLVGVANASRTSEMEPDGHDHSNRRESSGAGSSPQPAQ